MDKECKVEPAFKLKADKEYWREAFDRISVVQDMVERILTEHPVFSENLDDFEPQIDKIQLSLNELSNDLWDWDEKKGLYEP